SETDELFISYGTSNASLAQGPGWYDGTAPPGSGGNIAIAGHRTGFGAPFGDLDRMSAGDALVLETPQGQRRTYEVSTIMVVEPSATWVLGPNVLRDGSDTLTLTTCDPPGVNTRRLVVVARDVTG
ncbi:MAG: class E sortase, partial [Actinobacteria bacterium]|nr:class E sortase [Actinomycetota bacterium]